MKLRTKVLAFVLVISLLLVGVSIFGMYSIRRLGGQVDVMAERGMPVIVQVSRISEQSRQQSILLNRLQISQMQGEPSEMERIIRDIQRLDTAIRSLFDEIRNNLSALSGNVQYDMELLKVRNEYDAVMKMVNSVLDLVRSRGGESGMESSVHMVEMVEKRQARFLENLDELRSQVGALADESAGELQELKNDAMAIFTLLPLFAIVIGIAMAVYLIATINRQLGADPAYVAGIARRIADGDLREQESEGAGRKPRGLLASMYEMREGVSLIVKKTLERVEETRSETGELSSMSAETSSAAEEIGATISSLADRISGLSESVESNSSSVQHIRRSIDELGEQVENQSSAVSQTSASMEEMSASLQNIARTAHEKKESSGQLVESVQQGRENVDKTVEQVDELSRHAAEIQDVIGIINSVSSQTNLLSMNAAIEAAHAGESGKGFAVVAEEIRKLAESTSQNAKKIGDNLKQNDEIIERLQNSFGGTRKFYEEVERHAGETSTAFTEILNTLDELSTGAEEIQNAVQTLSETSDSVKGGAEEIQRNIALIDESTGSEKQISKEVLSAMQEMRYGAQEISEAIHSLNSSIESITESMNGIVKQVSTFKIRDEEQEGEIVQADAESDEPEPESGAR